MKTNLLLLVFATLLVIGCGDNDEADPLIGTWQLKSISATGCDVTEDNISIVLDDDGCLEQDGITLCILQLFTFRDNGNLDINVSFEVPGFDLEELGFTIDDIDIDGLGMDGEATTWSMVSDSVIEICDSDGCNDVMYRISGDSLTLTGADPDEPNCVSTLVYEKN